MCLINSADKSFNVTIINVSKYKGGKMYEKIIKKSG